ncbi:copper oxidase [bacterium M00.F.Ca.ET.228.01.1.1]|nr:multicopper oxidase domain-containing protein [Paraburkholderia phenoliruptrix]MBW9098669.1 multicopper oxidase domain-containing protein [Paraburkholderia phenoliruptrix]TGP42536.1 copper oxidase [bacterium M00.F.Ca.ET.228.01.1.1]TGS00186.1 copper oxidase [bacterium M00.F.Ca.ET.191.01.1.1]TGU04507.1 copper oxidase [bacterium M00.F.Ca.ET.155.01.1.1]
MATLSSFLALVPPLGAAQSSLDARSFDDLSDTPEASAENALSDASGGLGSKAERLQCLKGLNPSGNSGAVKLKVQMGTYRIYNPSTDAFDTVWMRSYNGCPTGPTISVKPDARLKVTLDNQLEANNPPANCPANPDHSTPHCFNDTNLHTHGLHISPSGDQDNVLITVHPGDKPRVFNFQIPANHPSGTFWYHAHLHGSTAINVASGMAGVLIVRGSRPARAGVIDGSADIDTILHRKQPAQPLREHVLLFQQIEYGCFGSASSEVPLADPTTFEWQCPTGSKGEIRGYNNQLAFVPDPRPGHAGQLNSTWVISGRYTQINGIVQPVFPSATTFIPAGEIRRLRMVHGGNRDTINVKFVRANLSTLGLADSQTLSAAQVNAATISAASKLAGSHTKSSQAVALDALCNGEIVKQLEFAEDGITMSAMVEKDVNSMDPGYRSDVLVAFPSPGLYCMLDEAADASATINFRINSMKAKDRRLLALARVGPGTNIADTTVGNHSRYWQYIRDQLVAGNSNLPEPARSDLASLKLRAFAPTIPVDGPVANVVPAQFDIQLPGPTNPIPAPRFVINGETYDPAKVAYTGVLGNIDQWNVSATVLATHVFHIHTNPFRIMDITNAAGHSVFNSSGGCSAEEAATGDAEYCNLQGVVRDTLFLKAGYTLSMRTIYQDFTGEFVMHCHILDHEDRGMMENVSVVSPATAYLQRVTAPLSALTHDTARWLARLRGKDETQVALAGALCTARDYARR